MGNGRGPAGPLDDLLEQEAGDRLGGLGEAGGHAEESLTVVLCEDHPIPRLAIASGLRRIEGIAEVVEATTGPECTDAVERTPADVVLCDVNLPTAGGGFNGVEAVRRIRAFGNNVPIVMLTAHSDVAIVSEALEAGASGYMLKTISFPVLVTKVFEAARGASVFDDETAQQVAVLSMSRSRHGELAPREREAVVLASRGWSNTRIGDEMGISAATVKHYLARSCSKLGISDDEDADHSRVALARRAFETRLVGGSTSGV